MEWSVWLFFGSRTAEDTIANQYNSNEMPRKVVREMSYTTARRLVKGTGGIISECCIILESHLCPFELLLACVKRSAELCCQVGFVDA
jgi:hypothetical protein